MANLKTLRIRIASVKSTQKITSAMKMIAATKLRRAQAAAEEGRPYADRMERMLADLIASMATLAHAPKLLAGSGSDSRHLLVVMTGDRGLCGAFNSNVVREAKRRIAELQKQGKQVKLLIVGRKGADALRREYGSLIVDVIENATRYGAKFEPARDLGRRLGAMFHSGDFDVCTIVYNTFKSAISQVVTAHQIIPFPHEAMPKTATDAPPAETAAYEMEPDEDELLAELLPSNLSMQIFRAMSESYASEQGARMTAMDNATRNAGDMINRLTLTYNRSRQAAITTELIEIISGANALA
jgi:F-type H+-transporting ATPase subunit gamma